MSSRQVQQQKPKNKQLQAQFEIYHNDNYLSIFAEIERLFRFLGKDVGHEFRQCLISADQSMTMVMLNIEGFLDTLDGFKLIGKKHKLEEYNPPTNCQDLYVKWSKALEEIDPENHESTTAKQLLEFLVKKLSKNEPLAGLPRDIKERIMSEKQRDVYCSEISKNKNGQAMMMNLVNNTQQLADNISAQVEKLAENPRNLKFSRRPIIDVQHEDFPDKLIGDDVQPAQQPLISPEKKDGQKKNKSRIARICKCLSQLFRQTK
jgi:hypothetical protein